MYEELDPQAAHARLKGGEYVYLDVRTVEEFQAGRPAGARNVPLLNADQDSGRMVPNPAFLDSVEKVLPKDAKIIVGCKSGGRSASACQVMAQAGYKHLWNMQGGFHGKKGPQGSVFAKGWTDHNLPTESGAG